MDVLEVRIDGGGGGAYTGRWLGGRRRHFADGRLIGKLDRDRFGRARGNRSGAQSDRRFRLRFQVKPNETDALRQT